MSEATHSADRAALKQLIADAFRDVPAPAADEIAPHRCCECDALAEGFAGHTADAVPDEVVSYELWSLPLFSAAAKRYYLPAWLTRSIDEPGSDFTDTLVYDLDSDHRHEGYTPAQRQAICRYLEFLIDTIDDELDSEILRALERWQ